MNEPPGLGISSNPSLCVSLLELLLRCCIFAPVLLVDMPCFSSALMMVSSCASYNHRNCCSISMQIFSRIFQCPALEMIVRPHTQLLLNVVCSTFPKIAPLEALRVAGLALFSILHSPHGMAVDALLSDALIQPAYEKISVALKQRFLATVRINSANEPKFCSFVRDFALVHILSCAVLLNLFLTFHVLKHSCRFADVRNPKTVCLRMKRPHQLELCLVKCIPAGDSFWVLNCVNVSCKRFPDLRMFSSSIGTRCRWHHEYLLNYTFPQRLKITENN
jgi:hypothetical protein